MPTAITKIPIRKKMKGADAGRALIKSYVWDYVRRNDSRIDPMYTQAEFDEMVSNIQSDYERRIYFEHVNLYNGIVAEFTRAQGALQQAQYGYLRMHTLLVDAQQARAAAMWLEEFSTALSINQQTAAFQERKLIFDDIFNSLWDISQSEGMKLDILSARTEFFYPSLSFLHAFNALFNLISRLFNVHELELFLMDTDNILEQMADFNELLDSLKTLRWGEDALKLIDKLFPPLDLSYGQPSDSAIASVSSKLHDPASYQSGSLQALIFELQGRA